MRILLTALAFFIAATAHAGTLGITGAEFRLGAVATPETSPDLTLGFSAVNVAITDNHGLQLDAGLEGSPAGTVGRIGGHLFMTPRPGQKYGLFATLSDLDGEARTWGAFGVEGVLALSPDTSAELRGGIGYGSEGLDWISLSAGLVHERGATTLHATLSLTEFDEPGLSTIATEVALGAESRVSGRLGAFVEVRHTGVEDSRRNALRAGLTVTFGAFGGAAPEARFLRTGDPVALLIRHGRY